MPGCPPTAGRPCTQGGVPSGPPATPPLGPPGPGTAALLRPCSSPLPRQRKEFFTFFSFYAAQPANFQKRPLASRSFSSGKRATPAAGVSVYHEQAGSGALPSYESYARNSEGSPAFLCLPVTASSAAGKHRRGWRWHHRLSRGARLLSPASASAHQKHAWRVRASLCAWVCAQSSFPSAWLLRVPAGPGPPQPAVSFLVLFTRSPRLSPPIPVEVLGTYLPHVPPTPTP